MVETDAVRAAPLRLYGPTCQRLCARLFCNHFWFSEDFFHAHGWFLHLRELATVPVYYLYRRLLSPVPNGDAGV